MRNYLILNLLMSVITAFIYKIDKKRAIKNKYRIKERTLLLCSFCFGSIGGLYSLYVLRHKSKHIHFLVLNWIFLIIHLVIGYLIYKNYWQN